jgi:hypothetical protein
MFLKLGCGWIIGPGGLILGGGGNSGLTMGRGLNSNGKSTTGMAHSNNHEALMDQFVRQTPGGTLYIPSSGEISKLMSSP